MTGSRVLDTGIKDVMLGLRVPTMGVSATHPKGNLAKIEGTERDLLSLLLVAFCS